MVELTLLNDLLSFALSLLPTSANLYLQKKLMFPSAVVNLHPEGSGFPRSFGLTVYIMRLAFALHTRH